MTAERRPREPGTADRSLPGPRDDDRVFAAARPDGAGGVGPGERRVVQAGVQVIWGAATDTGRVRSLNEDAVLAAPPVFLVSDGMGGHAAGDRASALVAESFAGLLAEQPAELGAPWIRDRVREAGSRIREGSGGGATVAGLAVTRQDGRPYWIAFNIGDSRVYRCTDGVLEQISVDHSYVQELVDAGQLDPGERRRHPQRNVITRAVGMVGDDDIDCWVLPAEAGERLLVCSDGVTGELTDDEIGAVLAGHVDPQEAATAVVAAAVAAGGRDNASALVVDVLAVAGDDGPDGAAPHRTLERADAVGADGADGGSTLPRSAWGGVGR